MWAIADAAGVLDDLESSFVGICSVSDGAIASAKKALAVGDVHKASALCMRALETIGDQCKLQTPRIAKMREYLHTADQEADQQQRSNERLVRDLNDTRKEVKVLRSELATVQHHLQRSDLSRDKARQRVLLGQAAYSFANLVERCVFNGAPTGHFVPLSLKQMQKMHMNSTLTAEQSTRWLAVPNMLPAQVSWEQLVQTDKYLRQLRHNTAHGSDEQNERTTLQELVQWTDQQVMATAVQPVKQLLYILDAFSTSDSPLCPDKSLDSAV